MTRLSQTISHLPTFKTGIGTRRLQLAMGMLALLSLLWNTHGIGAYPFWSDEAYTVLQVRAHHWHDVLVINRENEETPPVFFFLLRLWTGVWGDSHETTLRLFSACCMAATVPLIGLLGYRLWGAKVSLAAMIVFVANPLVYTFGREARSYALGLLLITCVLLAAMSYRCRPSYRAWFTYVVAGSLAVYTNYFSSFWLFSIGVFVTALVWRDWHDQPSRQHLVTMTGWVGGQLAIIALLLPWLPTTLYQYHQLQMISAVQPASVTSWQGLMYKTLSSVIAPVSGPKTGSPVSWWLRRLVMVAMSLAVIQFWHNRRRGGVSWLLAFTVVPFALIMPLFSYSGFYEHYLIFMLPGYVLIPAVGLRYAGRHLVTGLTILLIAAYVFLAMTVSLEHNERGQWDQLAMAVQQDVHDGEGIFFAPPYDGPAFRVQYNGPFLPRYGVETFADYPQLRGQNPYLDAGALQKYLTDHARGLIAWDHTRAPRPVVPAGIAVTEQQFGTLSLLIFTKTTVAGGP